MYHYPTTKQMMNSTSKQSLQNLAKYYESNNLLGMGYNNLVMCSISHIFQNESVNNTYAAVT